MRIKFTYGKKNFEIRQEASGAYAGYLNGERSVTGPRRHVVARVLIKKHVLGQPEATVLRFPRSDWQDDALSPEAAPDLAG